MLSLILLALSATGVGALAPVLTLQSGDFLRAICDESNTNIATYTDWCTDYSSASVCGSAAWTGVECTVDRRAISRIIISNGGIEGVWPEAEFAALPPGTLTWLSVSAAQLHGTIGAAALLAQRMSLEKISLRETPLAIDVPLAINTLGDTIVSFEAHASGAFGDVSTFDGDLCDVAGRLSELRVSFGELRGAFAANAFSACQFRHFSVVDLRNNALTGPMPPALCLMEFLQHLDLSYNEFTDLDACFAHLDSGTIVDCQLNFNSLCDAPADPINYRPCVVDSKSHGELDECGVCHGDSSSCIDCRGVRNGTAVQDACGVCEGNNGTCTDCRGVLFGTAVEDACGECAGDGLSCADCAGVPNGSACYDMCDVCGGDSLSCVDCEGVLFGSVLPDVCGVCGGDGLSCLDCAGEPHGTLCYDACDVCGGDGKSCVDCRGVRGGSVAYDACGVCGGDGHTCTIQAIIGEDSELKTWMYVFTAAILVACLVATCCALGCCRRPKKSKKRSSS